MHGSRDLEPLFPDRSSGEPVGRQFTRRLRQAIESGLYKPSSRLLPRRELALRLGLARNTVSSAIEQLIAEGYLESRIGSGTSSSLRSKRLTDRTSCPRARAGSISHTTFFAATQWGTGCCAQVFPT